MFKTIAVAAFIVLTFSAAQAQTDVITGTMQELPTTVIAPPNPALQLPQGNVSIITTPPNIPPSGVFISPGGPLPGMNPGGFVTLGAPPAPPTWAPSAGQSELSTKAANENHEGRWICRANYNGMWFVGHRVQGYGKNMCLFALGANVQTADVAQMLWQFPNVPVRWMSLQGNQMPQGIFASDPARGLPVCRAVIQRVAYVGWADKNGCHFVQGESNQRKGVTAANFEIIALGEIKPKPPGQQGPNINLGGIFDLEPNRK